MMQTVGMKLNCSYLQVMRIKKYLTRPTVNYVMEIMESTFSKVLDLKCVLRPCIQYMCLSKCMDVTHLNTDLTKVHGGFVDQLMAHLDAHDKEFVGKLHGETKRLFDNMRTAKQREGRARAMLKPIKPKVRHVGEFELRRSTTKGILPYHILSHSILSCPALSYPTICYLILPYPIPSYAIHNIGCKDGKVRTKAAVIVDLPIEEQLEAWCMNDDYARLTFREHPPRADGVIGDFTDASLYRESLLFSVDTTALALHAYLGVLLNICC